MHPRPEYAAFLLRLWREGAPRPPDAETAEQDSQPPAPKRAWLAQVEHIPTGEKQYFSSLEELFGFIRESVGEQ